MQLRQSTGLAIALVLGGAAHAVAQPATLASDLLTDWQRMRQTMLSIGDAMPEDRFDYASTPAQRTFGEQLLHVAGGNVFLLGFLGAGAEAPTIDRRNFRTFGHTATTKGEILEILEASFDYGEAVLSEFVTEYEDRILPLDRIAGEWAARFRAERYRSGRVLDLGDALIAGTARAHELSLATRNVRDFDRLGVEVTNPWEA